MLLVQKYRCSMAIPHIIKVNAKREQDLVEKDHKSSFLPQVELGSLSYPSEDVS